MRDRSGLLGALGRLARRRSLAASTRTLLADLGVALVFQAVGPIVARLRPIAGTRRWSAAGRPTARRGPRRWFVAGTANPPVHVRREEHRGAVERAVAACDGAVDTARVLDALRPAARGDPWYVGWSVARRAQTWALDGDGRPPPDELTAAPTWSVWRAYEDTEGRPTGAETATTWRAEIGQAAPAIDGIGEPVDVVYTWVDDADPAWRQARQATRRSLGLPASSADDVARFRQHDELRYSLRSLWHHASWVRRIFVVTSGQVPAWLHEDERLRLVRHDELLPADALPTFNSHAIESSLHRIDGLAEHFVYLNDDMFLHRPLEPTTFFEPGSPPRPRTFLDAATVPPGDHPPGMYRAAARTNAIVRRLTGDDDRRMVRHAPYALTRSLLAELHELLPDELGAVAHQRFRAPDDISLAASLAPKYALAAGRAAQGRPEVEYVGLGHVLAGPRLRRLVLLDRFDLSCLNTTDADPAAGPDGPRLRRWMQRLAPVPSPWE